MEHIHNFEKLSHFMDWAKKTIYMHYDESVIPNTGKEESKDAENNVLPAKDNLIRGSYIFTALNAGALGRFVVEKTLGHGNDIEEVNKHKYQMEFQISAIVKYMEKKSFKLVPGVIGDMYVSGKTDIPEITTILKEQIEKFQEQIKQHEAAKENVEEQANKEEIVEQSITEATA